MVVLWQQLSVSTSSIARPMINADGCTLGTRNGAEWTGKRLWEPKLMPEPSPALADWQLQGKALLPSAFHFTTQRKQWWRTSLPRKGKRKREKLEFLKLPHQLKLAKVQVTFKSSSRSAKPSKIRLKNPFIPNPSSQDISQKLFQELSLWKPTDFSAVIVTAWREREKCISKKFLQRMYSPACWFQFRLTKAILLCITHSSLRGTYSAHTMFFYWAHLSKLLQLLTNISYIVTCI